MELGEKHESCSWNLQRKSDYLAANDIEMTDDYSSVSEHFPLKFCGHRFQENRKVSTRFLKVIEMMIKFLREYKAGDKFPAKDERFPLLLQSITSSIFPAYCEFSLSVARDIEPFFDPFSN